MCDRVYTDSLILESELSGPSQNILFMLLQLLVVDVVLSWCVTVVLSFSSLEFQFGKLLVAGGASELLDVLVEPLGLGEFRSGEEGL